ncbi:MAG TPA: alpha/beta hydrolase [Allosphingosinicella sp.]|jgi:pimeloyl-ACP methyl ester carboxylesterase
MRKLLQAALAATALLAPVPAVHAAPAPVAAPAFRPTRFSVVVEGKGPDVLLIPGLSTPREVWDGARTALAGRYRLHLVQLNGFGGSPAGANADGEILAPAAAELERYIEANRLDRPAIVGHSLGGLLGLLLAERAPDKVGRLMAVDSLPFAGALAGPAATAESLKPQAAAMRDMMAAPATPEQRSAAAARIAAALARTPAARDRVASWVAAADPKVAAEMTYEGFTTDARPRLAALHVPVTVLYAWNEGTLPEAQARALFEGAWAPAPRVRFQPVADSFHFVMLDQPDRFADLLREFLGERP